MVDVLRPREVRSAPVEPVKLTLPLALLIVIVLPDTDVVMPAMLAPSIADLRPAAFVSSAMVTSVPLIDSVPPV